MHYQLYWKDENKEKVELEWCNLFLKSYWNDAKLKSLAEQKFDESCFSL